MLPVLAPQVVGVDAGEDEAGDDAAVVLRYFVSLSVCSFFILFDA